MRITGLVLALVLASCAHGKAGSDVHITVMQTGSIYPPFADDCPVDLVNAQHIDILTSGQFDQLGMVAFSGTGEEIDRAMAKLPGAVAIAACKMGGTAVSIANALRTSSDVAMLQFSIWRALDTGKKPAGPAKSADKSI